MSWSLRSSHWLCKISRSLSSMRCHFKYHWRLRMDKCYNCSYMYVSNSNHASKWLIYFLMCLHCSMEECEALCTRMAIMVNGQFKCLGSTQHLKTKFGEGYTLLAKIVSSETADLETNTRTAMSFIENAFPGSVLKDIHQGYLHYQIPAYGVTWATLFGTMENNRKAFHIEDYSVSQTTLEQVFINFARAQRPPLEGAQKCITQCGNCCRFFFCGGCCDEPNYGHKETTATHIWAPFPG